MALENEKWFNQTHNQRKQTLKLVYLSSLVIGKNEEL